MRYISVEMLLEVLKEHGLDHAYEILERFFIEEPLVFIDSDGKAVFTPFETVEIYEFLEAIYEKFNLFDKEVCHD